MTDWKHVRDWTRKHVNLMSKIHWNKVAMHDNSSEKTWDTTYNVCKQAKKAGYMFACEVKMLNGRRADIIIPELNQVIEVYDTETQDSLDLKQEDYGYIMCRVPAGKQAILIKDKTE